MTRPEFIVLGGLALIGYIGVWAAFMLSPARRSFRSVVYLAASSLLIPVAAMLEPPWRFVLAAAIVGF